MTRIRYTMPAMSQVKLYMQHAMARTDEARMVNARGLTPTNAVKALIKATGLNPHLSVCGWPFCLDDLGGVDDAEGV